MAWCAIDRLKRRCGRSVPNSRGGGLRSSPAHRTSRSCWWASYRGTFVWFVRRPPWNLKRCSRYSGASPPPAHHKVYVTGAYCSYPAGIGSVHITSADDVDSPVDFNTGVFARYVHAVCIRPIYRQYAIEQPLADIHRTGRKTWPSCAMHGSFVGSTPGACPRTGVNTLSIIPNSHLAAQRRWRHTIMAPSLSTRRTSCTPRRTTRPSTTS